MKVILLQTVPKVGRQGTVVDVATGFARNYLFRRGLAIMADKRQIAALEKRNASIAAKTAGEKSNAEALKEKLNGKSVRIPAQVGAAQGKLFGAITSQNIADAIKSQLGSTVERKEIALIDPIKRLGNYQVALDLHHEVEAIITVTVFDPNVVEAEAPATDEAAGDEE